MKRPVFPILHFYGPYFAKTRLSRSTARDVLLAAVDTVKITTI
jgi:hypothetical protein